MTLSKFVDSSFPQCNVHTSVQGGCLVFTLLDGYLKRKPRLIFRILNLFLISRIWN